MEENENNKDKQIEVQEPKQEDLNKDVSPESNKDTEGKKVQINRSESYLSLKRVIDLIGASLALIAYAPAFFIIKGKIENQSEGDVIVTEECYGKNNVKFKKMRFRTLAKDLPKDVPTYLIKNSEQYQSEIGRFLIRTGLEDLPQLMNIFRGEMSFIGPRPARLEQVELVQARQAYGINSLRPGVSGLAKLSNCDENHVADELYYDKKYYDNLDFGNDFRLFIEMTKRVIKSFQKPKKEERKESNVVDYTWDKDLRKKD